MKRGMRRGGWCLALLSIWGLVGCAYGARAIPDDLKDQITPGVTFKEVIRDPGASIGRRILWGGTIVRTTVSRDGTVLEVLQKPLDDNDRPLQTDESKGRFLVERFDAFLDPAIYKEGREITIVGEIIDEREQPVGEMVYRYPYVVASHIHLWRELPLYADRRYAGYPYGYPFYPYYPYPYFFGHRHRHFGPHRHFGH
ncbi:MAG: Slp family lipoprotein, partial [Nitrospiria bacterium]